MYQAHDEEIDLFELFEILWSGKVLIISFTALSLLLGGFFLALKEAKYESQIFIKIDNRPPFYNQNKILTDFEKLFFSPQTFREWKKSGVDTSLIFDNFSTTIVVDGFELSKDEDDLQVLIQSKKRAGHFLLIRSGQPKILDGFLNYSKFVKSLINERYIKRAMSELKIIDRQFNNLSLDSADINIIETVLSIDRFITSLENGGDVLIINNPTIPEKVFPKPILVSTLFVFLGGMVGVVLVLVRSKIAKRKDQLIKV